MELVEWLLVSWFVAVTVVQSKHVFCFSLFLGLEAIYYGSFGDVAKMCFYMQKAMTCLYEDVYNSYLQQVYQDYVFIC